MSEGRWELGDTEYDLSLRESYYKGEKIEPGLEGRNVIGRRRERGLRSHSKPHCPLSVPVLSFCALRWHHGIMDSRPSALSPLHSVAPSCFQPSCAPTARFVHIFRLWPLCEASLPAHSQGPLVVWCLAPGDVSVNAFHQFRS